METLEEQIEILYTCPKSGDRFAIENGTFIIPREIEIGEAGIHIIETIAHQRMDIESFRKYIDMVRDRICNVILIERDLS